MNSAVLRAIILSRNPLSMSESKTMNDFKEEIEKRVHWIGNEIQRLTDRVSPLFDEDVDFSPRCDVIDSGGNRSVVLDLPGMRKEDILITLRDRVLTVRGERRLPKEDAEHRFSRRERKGGFFSRSFPVSSSVSREAITAEFSNGVLTVTFPQRGDEGDGNGDQIPIG